MAYTHTYVTMDVSARAYAEIRAKMEAAGYGFAIAEDDGKECIDMHGIALKALPAPAASTDSPTIAIPKALLERIENYLDGLMLDADGEEMLEQVREVLG